MKLVSIVFLILFSGCVTNEVFIAKKWHKPNYNNRFYPALNEPISMRSVSSDDILKICIGDSIEKIENLTGQPAKQYYYEVPYLTLFANSDHHIWEVAILVDHENKISDISWKKIEIENPFK